MIRNNENAIKTSLFKCLNQMKDASEKNKKQLFSTYIGEIACENYQFNKYENIMNELKKVTKHKILLIYHQIFINPNGNFEVIIN